MTDEDAVRHLLDEVGPDYSGDFWATDDGKSINRSRRALDFSVTIYPSVAEAVKAQSGMDDEALPTVLRSLADAVDRFCKN